MNNATKLLLGIGDKSDAIAVARAAGLLASKAKLVVKGVAARGGGANWGVEVFIEVEAPLMEAKTAVRAIVPEESDGVGNYDDNRAVRTSTIGAALQLGSRLGIRNAIAAVIQDVRDQDEATGRRLAFRVACAANGGRTLPTPLVPKEQAVVRSVVLKTLEDEIFAGAAALCGQVATQDEVIEAFFNGYEVPQTEAA